MPLVRKTFFGFLPALCQGKDACCIKVFVYVDMNFNLIGFVPDKEIYANRLPFSHYVALSTFHAVV